MLEVWLNRRVYSRNILQRDETMPLRCDWPLPCCCSLHRRIRCGPVDAPCMRRSAATSFSHRHSRKDHRCIRRLTMLTAYEIIMKRKL